MASYGRPQQPQQAEDSVIDMRLYAQVLEEHQDKLRDFRTIAQVEEYVCTKVNYLKELPKQVQHFIRDYADIRIIQLLIENDPTLSHESTWRKIIGHCITILLCLDRHPNDPDNAHATYLFREVGSALNKVFTTLQDSHPHFSGRDMGNFTNAYNGLNRVIPILASRGIQVSWLDQTRIKECFSLLIPPATEWVEQ